MKNPFKPFQEFLNDKEYQFFIAPLSDENYLKTISLSSAYKLAAYILEVKDSKLSKELFAVFQNHELNTYQILQIYLDLNYPISEEPKTNAYMNRRKKNESLRKRLEFIKSLHDQGIIDDGHYTYFRLHHL